MSFTPCALTSSSLHAAARMIMELTSSPLLQRSPLGHGVRVAAGQRRTIGGSKPGLQQRGAASGLRCAAVFSAQLKPLQMWF